MLQEGKYLAISKISTMHVKISRKDTTCIHLNLVSELYNLNLLKLLRESMAGINQKHHSARLRCMVVQICHYYLGYFHGFCSLTTLHMGYYFCHYP